MRTGLGLLLILAGCAQGDGFVIRDGGNRDAAIGVDAGRPDGSLPPTPTPPTPPPLPPPPPRDGGTPTPPPPPPGDSSVPTPPPPPPPTDAGTFMCTVGGPVVPDIGPACTTTTIDCIVLCPTTDPTCQQRCIEADTTPGMACGNCVNSNFIACAQRMGCQAAWDTFACCAEQRGCLTAPDLDSCITAMCARESDAYSACDAMHGDACSSEVVAECFPAG